MTGFRISASVAAGMLCAASLAAAPFQAEVTADRVILRATPEADGEIVGQVMAGDRLEVLSTLGTQEWARVAAPPSVDLWIFSDLIRDGRIAASRVQVRAGPSLNYQRVGEVTRGTVVDVRSYEGEWARVAPPKGSALWINRAFITEYVIPAEPDKEQASVPPTPPSDEPHATSIEDVLDEKPIAAAPKDEAETEGLEEIETTLIESEDIKATAPSPTAQRPFQPEVAERELPPLPRVLAGYVADAHRPQHKQEKLRGRLVRIPYQQGSYYTNWQLESISYDRTRQAPICRLIGLEGQLKELENLEVEVDGYLWNLAGENLPVIEMRRLITLP